MCGSIVIEIKCSHSDFLGKKSLTSNTMGVFSERYLQVHIIMIIGYLGATSYHPTNKDATQNDLAFLCGAV